VGRSPIFSIRGAVASVVAEEGLAQLKPGEPLRGTPPVTSVGSPLCGLPDGWEVSANDTAGKRHGWKRCYTNMIKIKQITIYERT